MKSCKQDEIQTSLDEIFGVSPQMKLNPPHPKPFVERFHRIAISSTIVDLFRLGGFS